tara:strand:+ start:3708 stop:6128 length:2421 start_codon:yes stop_codon:yes gene_type:complete
MVLRKGILSLVDKFGFYSKAESVATEMPQKIMTGEQARAFFKKKGVKNEELDHLKLDDLFEKDNVTQDEIYETIEKNRIGFREERDTESDLIDDEDRREAWERADAEVGREASFDYQDLTYEEAFGPTALREEIDARWDEFWEENRPDLGPDLSSVTNDQINEVFGQLMNDILEEYASQPMQRITLMLPDADGQATPVRTQTLGEGRGRMYQLTGNRALGFSTSERPPRELERNVEQVLIDSADQAEDVLFSSARNAEDVGVGDRYRARLTGREGWGEKTLPGGENYQETRLAVELPEHRGLFAEDVHYPKDYDDVFAIRTKDRKGPNGEKILYVEELQSDWAQTGRGQFFPRDYDKNPPQSDFEAYERALRKSTEARLAGAPDEELIRLDDEANSLFDLVAESGTPNALKDLTRAEEIVAGGLTKEAAENRRFRHAPFVEKTESWNQLAIKRILRMAEEEGYDGVAFTPSQVQIDRWDTPGLRVQYDVAIPAALKSVTGRSYNNPDAKNVMAVKDNEGVEHKSEIIFLDDPSKDGKTIRETAKEGYPMFTAPVAGAGIASLVLGEDAAAAESDAPDLSFMQRLSGMINNRFPDEVIEDVNQQIGENIEDRKKQEFLKSIRKETQDLSRQFRKQFPEQFPEEEERSFTPIEHGIGFGEVIADIFANLFGPVAQAGAPAFASAFLPEGQTLTPDQIKRIGEEARVKFDEYDPQTEAGRWQKEQAMKEVESLLMYLGDESSPDPAQFLFQKGVMPALEAFEPIAQWLQDRMLDFTSRKQTLFGEEESPEVQEALREGQKDQAGMLSPI